MAQAEILENYNMVEIIQILVLNKDFEQNGKGNFVPGKTVAIKKIKVGSSLGVANNDKGILTARRQGRSPVEL